MEEKLYSPLFIQMHPDRNSNYYGTVNYRTDYVSQQEAVNYANEIQAAILKEQSSEKHRGLMEYFYNGGSVDEKVQSIFIDVEVHAGKLWNVATLECSEPLEPDEVDDIKDFLAGQYSDGFGESFDHRPIRVSDGELNVSLWEAGDDFFIETQTQFDFRHNFGYESFLAQSGQIPEPAEQPLTEAKLYSLVFVDLWEYDYNEGNIKNELSQYEAAVYRDEISEAIKNYREPGEAECGLMVYYDESDLVGEKVRSLFVDVEVHDNKLWAVTSLKTTESLTRDEFAALRNYIEGQFSDGWGESFEQQDIKIEDGDLNIHFWKRGEFYILTQEQFSAEQGLNLTSDALSQTAPELTPAQKALDEPDAFDNAEVTALRERLINKLDANLANYFDDLRGRDVIISVDKSSDIAAMTGAHYYLTELHNFHTSELNYLLQFKEPLQVVADEFRWDFAIENRSDIMWNVFHKQDALKNGRHALMSESEIPSFEELEQRLQNRLVDNFAVYKRDMMDLSGEELFKSAAEIASVSEAFDYFSKENGFIESEVEFLLKFENPLEFLSDKWDVGLRDLNHILEGIFDNQGRTLQNGGYALISDESSPIVPVTSANERGKTETNEKLSVMEEIRQAQKNANNRSTEPKETHGKKKTEPDL